jgi:hypothetical protein
MIFWVVTLCGPVGGDRRFGETCFRLKDLWSFWLRCYVLYKRITTFRRNMSPSQGFIIFWVVTLCGPVGGDRRFGETYLRLKDLWSFWLRRYVLCKRITTFRRNMSPSQGFMILWVVTLCSLQVCTDVSEKCVSTLRIYYLLGCDAM